MTNAIALYENFKGQQVVTGSYSSRRTFKFCPRKFQLERRDGWKRREERASALFGKCIEAGWQWFEENNREPGSGEARFSIEWDRVASMPNFEQLTYTDDEGDWNSLMRAGRELLRLYEIIVPRLPIGGKSRFQVALRKKIFPGTELDVLDNIAYLDMLTFPAWDHPALPPVPNPDGREVRPLIVDSKTSGVNLPVELVSLDPQLCEYGWQARIPDEAFLWWVKNSHTLERKNRVTLLERVEGIAAGTELFILGTGRPEVPKPPKRPRRKKGDPPLPPPPPAPPRPDIDRLFLGDAKALESYRERMRGITPNSNAHKAAEKAFFEARFVVACAPKQVTKQRIQFAAIHLDEQTLDDIGRGVAQDTVEMLRAHSENFYPRTGGIRFPDQKCNTCEMRGICSNNPELRDRLLTRGDEDWLRAGLEED